MYILWGYSSTAVGTVTTALHQSTICWSTNKCSTRWFEITGCPHKDGWCFVVRNCSSLKPTPSAQPRRNHWNHGLCWWLYRIGYDSPQAAAPPATAPTLRAGTSGRSQPNRILCTRNLLTGSAQSVEGHRPWATWLGPGIVGTTSSTKNEHLESDNNQVWGRRLMTAVPDW